MHIGIDALFRLPGGGGRTHLQRLLECWRDTRESSGDRVSVFTTPDGALQLQPFAGAHAEFHIFDAPARSLLSRLVWEQTAFPGVLARLKPDVLLCPGNLIPLRSPVPTVLMLQSPVPFCDGMTPRAFGLKAYVRFQLVGRMMRLSAARSDRVISVSEPLRDLFVERFNVQSTRTDVIGYGAEPRSLPNSDGNAETYPFPYVVYVSAIWPYKNMREVILAYEQHLRADPTCEWRLVLAGPILHAGYFAELKLLCERLQITDRVIFTGGVPHTAIDKLFRGAAASFYASTCESFGIPLLEALSAGVPIACADLPYARAVVGEAALTFNPNNIESIAAQFARLHDPALRASLAERGKQRAATFATWPEVAARTRGVLARIARKGYS